MAPVRVLITNDDGPPGSESPFVFGLYKHLRELGWEVKVVLPSSQKSWIGKAFQIRDTIVGQYYYPRDPDGMGDTSETSRPLKEGEIAEWVLLDGTPATCTNIALYNLYPGEIDIVISGPNYGRNTSAAFSLSSGTVGAALSSSLSLFRSIALSYGIFAKPCPLEYYEPAQKRACQIIQRLWNDWGKDPQGRRKGEVDLYSINIPMIPDLLQEGGIPVAWTRMWRNNYGRLFGHTTSRGSTPSAAGIISGSDLEPPITTSENHVEPSSRTLSFKFQPQFQPLINPPLESLPQGSDAWAVHTGKISVTPLRACFGQPDLQSMGLGSETALLEGDSEGGRIWNW